MLGSLLSNCLDNFSLKCLSRFSEFTRNRTARQYSRLTNFDEGLKGQQSVIPEDISTIHDMHLANMLNSLSVPGLKIATGKIKKNLALPYGHHLIYFNPSGSSLGPDGYDNYQAPKSTKDGSSLFKRRLWVGGKLIFNNSHPLKYLQLCNCFEIVDRVISSRGNMFVNIHREMKSNEVVNITESRMLIYTNEIFDFKKAVDAATRTVANTFDTSMEIGLSRNFLFRFSALSYNSHKIHYDIEYAQKVEKYPTVLVHGPLTVILLLQWFSNLHSELKVSKFVYKNKFPLFVTDRIIFKIKRQETDCYSLWLENGDGILCCESQLWTK